MSFFAIVIGNRSRDGAKERIDVPSWRQCAVHRLLLFVFVGLVGGCATYNPRPLNPPDEANAFAARSLDDPALQQFMAAHGGAGLTTNWPPPAWDLRLLTLAAFRFHADMEVARAKLAASEAAVITAGARPNPTVGFSPTYDADAAGGVSPWTLGFTLDVPIETAGKRGDRIGQARHAANSARLAFVTAAWQVRSRVRRTLVDLQAATLTEEILARKQAAENQAVELLEARLKAGQSSLTEVQLVRVAAAQSALQLRDAQRQATQASVRLADAVGVPANAVARLPLSFAASDRLPSADEAGAARRETLLNRADVLGALADYEASQSALQLEIARQYPDVHLGPGYAWDQGQNKFTLRISFTLPVFNKNEGPIAEAAAHRREAAANFAAVQARVIGEVELAFAGYRDALRKLETADTLLDGQRARMKSAQDSFAAGAADRVELLQAQAELGTNELARAQTFSEAQLALAQLEDAMQRPAGATATAGVPASVLNHESH